MGNHTEQSCEDVGRRHSGTQLLAFKYFEQIKARYEEAKTDLRSLKAEEISKQGPSKQ